MQIQELTQSSTKFPRVACESQHSFDDAYQSASSILSFLSHDIRNLTSVITLNAERLLDSDRESDRAIGHRIIDQVEHVTELCRETGGPKKALRAESYSASTQSDKSLADIINDVVRCLEGAGVPVRFKIFCAPEIGLKVSRVITFRILYNLISNAVHALKNTDDAEISVTAFSRAGLLQIDIVDNGPGLPSALEQRLMSGDTKNPSSGGLGILVAQTLTQEVQGEMTLVSSSQSGVHFRLKFFDLDTDWHKNS